MKLLQQDILNTNEGNSLNSLNTMNSGTQTDRLNCMLSTQFV